MANITERKDKNGKVNAYLIRVYRGKDAQGKQLKPYVMTWNPPDGWTKRSIEKELQKQAALFEENCKLGNVSTEKKTFESYANYVIDLKESTGIKPHTIRIYKECMKRLVDIKCNGIGYLKLQDIRAEHLNMFYLSLAKKGVNKHTGGGLSPEYIYEHHALISTVLTQAVEENLIPYNVAERAKPPKKLRREAECFDSEDIVNIIEALKGEPLKWQVIVNLLIATGARRGEIAGLKWENVDIENNQIYIKNNLLYAPDMGIYEGTPKNGDNRVISVAAEVMELVRQWRTEQTAIQSGGKVLPIMSGYLFTKADSFTLPIMPDSITKWLTRFSKKHNLPHINPHKFRHSQASLLINAGVDIVSVSKRLGHAKVSTTSDIYAHVINKADERASNVIADILYKKA